MANAQCFSKDVGLNFLVSTLYELKLSKYFNAFCFAICLFVVRYGYVILCTYVSKQATFLV
jgi:hypothetical protein